MHPGIHLVGSVAMADTESVFSALATELGPWLKRIPDGETGVRHRWIYWQREMLLNHPDMELDPEAAAAYLVGGSVAAAAVIAKRRASNATAAAAADVEAQEEAADDTVEESFLSTEEDADVTRDASFLSANSKDLGRRHTVLHVPECQSAFCTGCRSQTTFQEVSFVPATKINDQADDMALAGGAKAWLAAKVAAEEGKTKGRVRRDCA